MADGTLVYQQEIWELDAMQFVGANHKNFH